MYAAAERSSPYLRQREFPPLAAGCRGTGHIGGRTDLELPASKYAIFHPAEPSTATPAWVSVFKNASSFKLCGRQRTTSLTRMPTEPVCGRSSNSST